MTQETGEDPAAVRMAGRVLSTTTAPGLLSLTVGWCLHDLGHPAGELERAWELLGDEWRTTTDRPSAKGQFLVNVPPNLLAGRQYPGAAERSPAIPRKCSQGTGRTQ